MGLLSKGTPLTWSQALKHHDYIKAHGIEQFLTIYQSTNQSTNAQFKWGDEVEALLVSIDPSTNRARLLMKAPQVLEALENIMAEQSINQSITDSSNPSMNGLSSHRWNAHFVPEYGRFMVEGTPARPYQGYTSDLVLVEANMRLRRSMIQSLLEPNQFVTTMTAFPMMGVGDYIDSGDDTSLPPTPYGPIARSLYISDSIIGPHPRFATLTQNIRLRRGSNVCIRVPMLVDDATVETVTGQIAKREAVIQKMQQTNDPSINPTDPLITSANNCDENGNEMFPPIPPNSLQAYHKTSTSSTTNATDESNNASTTQPVNPSINQPIDETREIHMDAMAFGMGACCLQVTFQTRNVLEARQLYDQLAVLSPIFLALTAATPFLRGRIADIDVRWTVISQAVDDRTEKERGLKPIDASFNETNPDSVRMPQVLSKSRYDSISTYISQEMDFKPGYNDIECEIDQLSYDRLIEGGIDPMLAKHVAHLFVRDPLVIYDEWIHLDDNKSSDHFENLQSTNWQTVRFKPPPPPPAHQTPEQAADQPGWRVEFRTMEVQLTDFENAAFTVFIALISRAILYFKLNLYTKLSQVDANMFRAHSRDAINREKFHWRKSIKPTCLESNDQSINQSDETTEMTLAQILLGNPDDPSSGLIPIVRAYLQAIECDAATLAHVERYIKLIEMRATGELLTTASWFRKFVERHPDYKHDSQLTQTIVGDLMRTVQHIQNGVIECPQLLGELVHCVASNEQRSPNPNEGSFESINLGKSLKGAPTTLDLEDEDCCARFRNYLKQHCAKSCSSNLDSESSVSSM